MVRQLGLPVAFASLFGIAACGGGSGGDAPAGGGGSATAPPPVIATYGFPAGDATSAIGGIAWDIVGVRTTLTGTAGSPGGNAYDTLRVDVTFVQDVSNALPAPEQSLLLGSELGVAVALDVDGNANTGEYGSCNSTLSARPFEYFSDIGTQSVRLNDGNYSIVDPSGNLLTSGGSNPAGEAVTSVAGHTFSQSFYLPAVSIFAKNAIPRIGLGAAAFNGLGTSPTDCVPLAPAVELFTH